MQMFLNSSQPLPKQACLTDRFVVSLLFPYGWERKGEGAGEEGGERSSASEEPSSSEIAFRRPYFLELEEVLFGYSTSTRGLACAWRSLSQQDRQMQNAQPLQLRPTTTQPRCPLIQLMSREHKNWCGVTVTT